MKKQQKLILIGVVAVILCVGVFLTFLLPSEPQMPDYSAKAKAAALVEVEYRSNESLESVVITGNETRFSHFGFLDELADKTARYDGADTEQWIFRITYHVDTLEETTEGDFQIIVGEDWVAVDERVYSYQMLGWTSSAVSSLEDSFATAVKIYGN